MSQNDEILQKLHQLLSHKKSNSYYATKLGVSVGEIEELRKQIKPGKMSVHYYSVVPEHGETVSDLIITTTSSSTKVNVDEGTFESTVESDYMPKTVEDLADLHKIDLTRYKISNYWSKQKPNGQFTSSVFSTLIKKADYSVDDFSKFLEGWQPYTLATSGTLFVDRGVQEEVDVEINIADFHLAKKTFQKDTLETKEFDYYQILVGLVQKIQRNYIIRKIVFPISNDFFHTDNYQNQTTNGTPQDVTAMYDEEYEKGFDILANSITFLAKQAKEVEVILVQGNHDRTKGFYVAHALEVYFKKAGNVKFQRNDSRTKWTTVGGTFIGYHHGNSVKLDGLPIVFATSPDSSVAFGLSKYREIHTGDKHHYLAKEITGSGVRVQQMPSLSGTDRWHDNNGFINQIRAALALVYHPTKGKIAEFEERL